MKNGLKTVKDLFDGTTIFKVPIYQRAYSWSEDDQVKDFYEDIQNQKKYHTYFLGTILLAKSKAEGEFKGIEIIDGQQRITTLTIFIKALLEELKNNEIGVEILEEIYINYKGKYKLALQKEDNEFFQTYILGDDNNQPELVIKRPSQRKLLSAKNYFSKRLNKLNKEELIIIKNKINKTKLLTYTVKDNGEATLIFETINDRGKPLTNLEKIKSFLMYKQHIVLEESTDAINAVYKRFSDIYDNLEEINVEKEDNILQYHFIAFEEWGNKREYQEYFKGIKRKINNLLLEKKDEEISKYIKTYTTKLRDVFLTFKEINKLKSNNFKKLIQLKRLGILLYPTLIKTYNYDQKEKKEFEEIAKLLEILSFRVLGMKTKRSTDIDSAINILIRKFKGDFTKLKLEITEKILEFCDDNKFKEKLNSQTFYNSTYSTDRIYLFWQYENYLRSEAGYAPMSKEEFSSEDKRFELTIEHIAPQNPEEKSNVTTNECKFTDNTSDTFKEEYLHCIGNLTFDPRSANASKGRKEIKEKNSKYFQKAPFMTQNELEEYLEGEAWTENAINKRRTKIVNFALKEWDPREIVGKEAFENYINEKKEKEKIKKKGIFDEEYVKKYLNSVGSYNLLQELRKKISNITLYEEKINKHFIGFKNNKYYFAKVHARQNYILLYILRPETKNMNLPIEIKYDEKYQEILIPIRTIEDIKKYVSLVKLSKRYH